MSLDEWESLKARVNRLENQNRWLRVVVSASCLAFVCVFTMGQAKVGSTVEAQRFVLTSAKGQVQAELATIDGGYPRLTLRSPNGGREVEVSPLGLSVSDFGLSDRLPLAHYGGQGLYLTHVEGRMVLEVGGAQTKSLQLSAAPEMTIFDKRGSQIWHAP